MKLTPKQAWECFNNKSEYPYLVKLKFGPWKYVKFKPIPIEGNGADSWSVQYYRNQINENPIVISCDISIDFPGDWQESLHYKGMPFVNDFFECDYCENTNLTNTTGPRIYLRDNENGKSYCDEKCYEKYQLKHKTVKCLGSEILKEIEWIKKQPTKDSDDFSHKKNTEHYDCIPYTQNQVRDLIDRINYINAGIHMVCNHNEDQINELKYCLDHNAQGLEKIGDYCKEQVRELHKKVDTIFEAISRKFQQME